MLQHDSLSRADRLLEDLGVTPVINACGIYTDLGGSTLSASVWSVAERMNGTWVSMPDLLYRSGEAIAKLIGAEAARIVPGASAGLALAVGACIARSDHQLIESLPHTGAPRRMILQAAHRYKYVRCALMSGAQLQIVNDPDDPNSPGLEEGLGDAPAAVLHPAHLDAAEGGVPLTQVVDIAHRHDVPVVVDAAYMSFPVDLIGSYNAAGADLACFSAKYFWGPNAGGFVSGRGDLVEAIQNLDFTHFESGPHLAFGRAFKMDRFNVATTLAALQEWIAMDHADRWRRYAQRAEALVTELDDVSADVSPCGFTLDERVVDSPVNSILVRPKQRSLTSLQLESLLEAGRPSVRAIGMDEGLVACLETVGEGEDEQLAASVRLALDGR